MLAPALEPVEITGCCFGFAVLTLMVGYAGFARYITRRGDFFNNRRWKTAILAALVVFVFYLFMQLIPFASRMVRLLLQAPGAETNLAAVLSAMEQFFSSLTCFLPAMFVLTLLIFFILRYWKNGDHLLDMIWKGRGRDGSGPP